MREGVEIDDKEKKVVLGDVVFRSWCERGEEVGMWCVWVENGENM